MSRLNILKGNFLELPVLLYYNYTAKMIKLLSVCTKKRVYLRKAELNPCTATNAVNTGSNGLASILLTFNLK